MKSIRYCRECEEKIFELFDTLDECNCSYEEKQPPSEDDLYLEVARDLLKNGFFH